MNPRKTISALWSARVAAGGFLAIIVFYLVTEHWAHTLGALPYLLLLACPLLHLLMHRGHGGHGGSGHEGHR